MSKEELRNAQTQMLGVLADRERQLSMELFPAFNSIHEGYAVIREEIEEMEEELHSLKSNLNDMWTACRYNEKEGFLRMCTMAYHNARQAALEALQVMAMAEKAVISLKGEADDNRG